MHRCYRHIKDYKKYLNSKTATDISEDREKIEFIKEKTKWLVKLHKKIQGQLAYREKNCVKLQTSVQKWSQLSQLKYELKANKREIER